MIKEVNLYANGRRFSKMTLDFSLIPKGSDVVAKTTRAFLFDEVVEVDGEMKIQKRALNYDGATKYQKIGQPSPFVKFFF